MDTPMTQNVIEAGLKERPLRFDDLKEHTSCPLSVALSEDQWSALAGPGPAYAVMDPTIGLGLEPSTSEGGWFYSKVLWVVKDDYEGPVLIRGGQLDGDGEVRFGTGPSPDQDMWLPPADESVTSGTQGPWRDFPSFTRLSKPGCYAWQVDGISFSYLIVFSAHPIEVT